jgi:FAD/FMN-containing dehydrogenase
VIVNDVHSRLNCTRVRAVHRPGTVDDLAAIVRDASTSGHAIAISGGRHSMGGQQFLQDGVLIDTCGLDRVMGFDRERGLIAVEGGIQWPALSAYLEHAQSEASRGAPTWGIVQKQTGADDFSLAGSLSCNGHGRGLRLGPIVDQVEAFDLMDHQGCVRTCSRSENRELFCLAIGGYGLFGVMTRVVLRLRPRIKVRRVVSLEDTSTIMARFDERIRDGFLYGDFQFTIDHADERFMRRGVFSCYQPVEADTPLTANPIRFLPEEWIRLVEYAHSDKGQAFQDYASRYLDTSGQVYWSDAQLGAPYVAGYHDCLGQQTAEPARASEMITEIFVPRARLAAFMEAARADLIARNANLIYGTVRLIERDETTFLAWARERFACVVFNLHLEHTPAGLHGLEAGTDAFRSLIDLGIRHDGGYYLPYHRWARPDQVTACYPRMREFFLKKRQHDPDERFQSNWYRHYRDRLEGR